MVDTSSFHPRQQKGDRRSPARLKKSFRPSGVLGRVDAGTQDGVEGALEATSLSWEPQFAGGLTEVKTVEGPASRLIFQPQVSTKVAKKAVQPRVKPNHQYELVVVWVTPGRRKLI